MLDTIKPLLRQKKMNIGLAAPVWLRFSYERLPNFCFCCKIIGHTHKECSIWIKGKECYEQEGLPYGKRLRARVGGNGGSSGTKG